MSHECFELFRGYNYFHWYIGFYPRGKAVPQGFKNATAAGCKKTSWTGDGLVKQHKIRVDLLHA